MPGKLYGVGVGPGDPELITLKAKRILEEADCIAVPKTAAGRDSLALSIAEGLLGHRKEIIELQFPMSYDEKLLESSWNSAVASIKGKLDEDRNVAFVTLGDPTVYSTYMYVHKALGQYGYPVEIIPGITSFCASAARVGISLGENRETIAVIPSAYECGNLDDILNSFDNIVLMKISSKFLKLKEKLQELHLQDKAVVVSRCGLDGEMVERNINEVDENSLSYFTTMIIKKNGVG